MNLLADIAVGAVALAATVWWFAKPVVCRNCLHPVENHIVNRVPCCDNDDCSCPRFCMRLI